MFVVETVEEVIALGSCSSRLASVVGQASLWRIIFSKTDLVDVLSPRTLPPQLLSISFWW